MPQPLGSGNTLTKPVRARISDVSAGIQTDGSAVVISYYGNLLNLSL